MSQTVQIRKTGDTLLLSGELRAGAQTMPDLESWDGAVAKMNIMRVDDDTVWRDHDDVTLSVSASSKRYSYRGDPPTDDEEGNYWYEVEVTFGDGTILTFPNGDDVFYLELRKQGA